MNKVIAYIVSWHVAYASGNLNNGTNAGVTYLNANNGSGDANVNIGSQLCGCIKKLIYKNLLYAKTMALAKIENILKKVLVAKANALNSQSQIMKRISNLYERVYDLENIRKAHKNAKKQKGHYFEVQKICSNPDGYFLEIRKMLMEKTYIPSPYIIFKKKDYHKEREISKSPYFPDRIIQHCIMQILEPIWDKTVIRDTYASIKKRGIHDGLNRIKMALKNFKGTQYCLKLDIRKFYPSINHDILKSIIRKKIKDNDMLWLLDTIIDSTQSGIPIGNYLSQHFGNIYLTYLDHWLKEEKKVKYYFRYCDDLVIIHSDKDWLHKILSEIDQYLSSNLKLQVKDNYQIFPVEKRGIDFLGYRFYHSHILLRKSIALRLKSKIKKLSEKAFLNFKDICSIASYKGWLMHANCYNLTQKYFTQLNGKAIS